jgi:hypothetical protein
LVYAADVHLLGGSINVLKTQDMRGRTHKAYFSDVWISSPADLFVYYYYLILCCECVSVSTECVVLTFLGYKLKEFRIVAAFVIVDLQIAFHTYKSAKTMSLRAKFHCLTPVIKQERKGK